MDQVVVSHMRGGTPRGFMEVYVGRPSVLGNPFSMSDESEREGVVQSFRSYLREQWALKGPVRAELEELAERVRDGECIALQCWCAPKACHGDVIKEAINGINERIKQ
jgi:hypothetical protein